MVGKTTTTSIRLTAEERAKLDRAAEAARLGPSSYIRSLVLTAIGSGTVLRLKPDAMAVTLARVLGELGRIGGNVNQLARKANAGFPVPEAPLAMVTLELQRLTGAVLSLRRGRDGPR